MYIICVLKKIKNKNSSSNVITLTQNQHQLDMKKPEGAARADQKLPYYWSQGRDWWGGSEYDGRPYMCLKIFKMVRTHFT